MSLSPSDDYGSSHPEGQCPDSASGGTGLVPSRGALTGVGAGGENINIYLEIRKKIANLIACFQLVYPPPMDLLGSSNGSKYRGNAAIHTSPPLLIAKKK